MPSPELVLSNTTTFFSGNLENVFRKAREHGFKYLEILPYRWNTPEQILHWEKKYGIQVVGIHMPEWWSSLSQALKEQPKILEKIFYFVWNFYLGSVAANPGLQLASVLKKQNRQFYVLFHANVPAETGSAFLPFLKQFPVAIENIPFHRAYPKFYWDPSAITSRYQSARLVFDAGHLEISKKELKNLDIVSIYRQALPEIVHISYNGGFLKIHGLPNQKQQEELKAMFKLHKPKYIVLETNPLISIEKGKQLLERLIHSA